MKMNEASDFREGLTLLNILALAQKDMEEGRIKPFRSAFAAIRAQIREDLLQERLLR